MRLTLFQKGRCSFLLLKILRNVEQTIKLITIVLSIYESDMVFQHFRIRYSYLISCDVSRGGLSVCPMIFHMEVYPDV